MYIILNAYSTRSSKTLPFLFIFSSVACFFSVLENTCSNLQYSIPSSVSSSFLFICLPSQVVQLISQTRCATYFLLQMSYNAHASFKRKSTLHIWIELIWMRMLFESVSACVCVSFQCERYHPFISLYSIWLSFVFHFFVVVGPHIITLTLTFSVSFLLLFCSLERKRAH